jgi:hypothetical protein
MKEWTVAPESGRTDVVVSKEGITLCMADDARQKNFITRCDLADYAMQVPTEGWPPIRKVIADDFLPEQCAEIEAYIAELLKPL